MHIANAVNMVIIGALLFHMSIYNATDMDENENQNMMEKEAHTHRENSKAHWYFIHKRIYVLYLVECT